MEILFVSTRLGFTSFGGPVAHLGYFHEEYIRRRKWMDEKRYADLVALCQFLPGPASSQVGIGIGIHARRIIRRNCFLYWFHTPHPFSHLSYLRSFLQGFDIGDAGWIHGLKIVAVAVVANAIIGMAQKLTPDLNRKVIALFALVGTLLWQTAFTDRFYSNWCYCYFRNDWLSTV